MMKINLRVKILILLWWLPSVLLPLGVLASATNGAIDTSYKYAWSENVGWLNFRADEGNVRVTDSSLSGYVWSQNYGWINLSPSAAGVTNNAEGNLSGSAWGEGTGYIDFNNVSIDSNGVFRGTATGAITGTINFDPSGSIKVVTDWRPRSVREADTGGTTITPGGGSGGSGGQLFSPNPLGVVLDAYRGLILAAQNGLFDLVAYLADRAPLATSTSPGGPGAVVGGPPVITVYSGVWQLLTNDGVKELVFAPLPSSVRALAQAVPQLGATFTKVGVSRFNDLSRLSNARLVLPGLSASLGSTGGVPLAKVSPQLKSTLPPEIVFARAGHELIDLRSVLALSDTGEPEQRIGTLVGKQLTLVVRPEAPAKSVTGFISFRSRGVAMMSGRVAPFNLTAALGLAVTPPAPTTPVEQKLVLQEFAYSDPDHDGLYTATITAPMVDGEYEVTSTIDYVDPKLGKRLIRLVTVVDPEGYVYELTGGRETRIPGAVVSLLWLNPGSGKYELWPARDYQQINPQITGKSGAYSFLVPPGDYSVRVEAGGYHDYIGASFNVSEGNGVHTNIELTSAGWWPEWLNWQSVLLVVVLVLLIYQLIRDKLRTK